MFKEETQYCPMCQEWAEKYDQLIVENDELKKIIERLDVPKHEVIDMDIALENEKLKEENDELKTEFDKFEEQIKLQGNFIDGFLFATKNSEWQNKSILEDEADAIIEKVESDYVQLEKYKQALQEIKDILEQYLDYDKRIDKEADVDFYIWEMQKWLRENKYLKL